MKNISFHNKLIAVFILLLMTASIFRSLYFGSDLTEVLKGVDDWSRYAKQGLDIKNNGLLISSIEDNYNGPGGFLYNYFVAFLFFIFGYSLAPIYTIQTLLLGLSVAFIFWTFKDLMKKKTQIIFLCSLFAFATLDVFHHYCHVLLSENLGLFLFSTFIYSFYKSINDLPGIIQKRTTILIIAATLVRPNLVPLLVLYIGILFLLKSRKKSPISFSLSPHLIIVLIGVLIIPTRNFIQTGSWTILPTEGTSDSQYQIITSRPEYFLKKIAFCFGYLSYLAPEYKVRFHWIVMWFGYFIYFANQLKKIRQTKLSEISIHVFIVTYLVFSIVFITVHSYGYRSMLLINFIVLSFSILGFEILLKKFKQRKTVD